MDAGLGGERALADIRRVAVGRAIEHLVEHVRGVRKRLELLVRDAISKLSANSGFSFSVGMIETRLALPQRSPRPLSVPWICRAPARTAASEFATACSVSLCAWMPTWSPGTCFVTSATIASTSCGSVPPLVSQSTTQRAPAS